jgi:predicted tellurium resistance membrane protein TerC
MKHPQSITSLPESPEADRRRRMIRYGVAMGIRVLCIIACFFLQGWWLLVPIVGAVVLPYIAVVLANVRTGTGGTVERPGSLLPVRGQDADEAQR